MHKEADRVYGPFSFRAWLHGLPCLVVGCETRDRRPGRPNMIEQSHFASGGMGRKADYTTTGPLCWRHHNEYHRGRLTFERRHRFHVNGTSVPDLAHAVAEVQRQFKVREEGLSG